MMQGCKGIEQLRFTSGLSRISLRIRADKVQDLFSRCLNSSFASDSLTLKPHASGSS